MVEVHLFFRAEDAMPFLVSITSTPADLKFLCFGSQKTPLFSKSRLFRIPGLEVHMVLPIIQGPSYLRWFSLPVPHPVPDFAHDNLQTHASRAVLQNDCIEIMKSKANFVFTGQKDLLDFYEYHLGTRNFCRLSATTAHIQKSRLRSLSAGCYNLEHRVKRAWH